MLCNTYLHLSSFSQGKVDLDNGMPKLLLLFKRIHKNIMRSFTGKRKRLLTNIAEEACTGVLDNNRAAAAVTPSSYVKEEIVGVEGNQACPVGRTGLE
jgi:hypothetical protein